MLITNAQNAINNSCTHSDGFSKPPASLSSEYSKSTASQRTVSNPNSKLSDALIVTGNHSVVDLLLPYGYSPLISSKGNR